MQNNTPTDQVQVLDKYGRPLQYVIANSGLNRAQRRAKRRKQGSKAVKEER